MSQFGIVIMAAGKGTRLKSARPKVLHAVGGKALLLHVIEAAKTQVSAHDILVVVGHQAAQVQAAAQPTGVRFVLQPQQLGTGHALQCVRDWYAETGTQPPTHLIVLSGDVPLIRPETIAALRNTHIEQDAAMTILTAIPPDPTGYGRVLRKQDGTEDVAGIVEQKSLTEDQLATPERLREINSGIYAFRTTALFDRLGRLANTNSAGEFYLTDVAGMLVNDNERVVAIAADSVDEVLGANTIAEMMHLDASFRARTANRLMAAGVTIFRPDTTVIDASVQIAADTIIEPFVQLLGNTTIGPNCRIRSYSVIESCTLGEGVLVRNGCILTDSTVGDGAQLGPYAHLRPESLIGARAHVGNFVETKKTNLGEGSKANHLAYLGDAIIGAGSNIGAGVITCNYDGVNKHRTTIGDGVFVGSDSTLIAPVTLASGSYVAAGSSITDDVPTGALALGRARQVTKPGWAADRRAAARLADGNGS
ncbi:glucosamine-1-phosphate N-acetyltransferase, UDP-N-acetylglucosamine pyrophosphorylase [Terriglobus roseus DSM 18391]|uniref:Bifunctional protein GlmU n=1 Tax=Terriglobus roseus (strain DSM 18391 / NRRL B-41598 / KBS 63) TaxID=926566 RepID=I3ZEM4_TERRK|nr:bifunctional UDP-N-acetylglucosamine diphosphorylase/glucosamine-1-phosphate N-acetyltransferase GlmU [Terriglobus roseus]AFL87692.1 glucosamine-1-phosphate N-acetyltransferase, UDP-N-acetylglucosamine pyrophosphorylase [Terriglobus roseus DSM 18391]